LRGGATNVASDIAVAELIEISPSKADPRLAFLLT
jgi:hypothetical protein